MASTSSSRWLFLNDPDGLDPNRGRGARCTDWPCSAGARGSTASSISRTASSPRRAETIYDELWRAVQAADDADPLKDRADAERNAAALIEMARRSSAARDHDAGDGGADDGDAALLMAKLAAVPVTTRLTLAPPVEHRVSDAPRGRGRGGRS